MRKRNTILAVVLLFIFLLHSIMGSFVLLGVGSSAGEILLWVGTALLIVHAVIGIRLTIQTLRSAKNSSQHYFKQNAAFWIRRISGFAILILLIFHIGLYGGMQDGVYLFFPFTTIKLIAQLLLIVALAVHLFSNLRPLMVSLGVAQYKERWKDWALIFSVILLFVVAAVVLYYVGWKQI